MKFMESSSSSSVDGRGVGRCTPAPVALLTDSLSGDGGSSLAGTAMALCAIDSESLYRSTVELGCEVVIASGANSRHADGVPGLETTAALYEAMAKEARARVSVLPDVGHFAPMEAPAAYARHVWAACGARSRL